LPPVDNSPPPEDLSTSAQSDPVEQAAQGAIKDRLAELENAESISQQPQPPQYEFARTAKAPNLRDKLSAAFLQAFSSGL
jgi:hypothetical protein